MTVYLAWTSEDLADLEGPWHEAMLLAPGLIAVAGAGEAGPTSSE